MTLRKSFRRGPFEAVLVMSTLPRHDHTSDSTPSLDGKGGTDPAAKGRKSTKRTGPSYVYYRLYTKLGAFESNHALYHNDRFIGRVPSNYFAPPHTVASIKRSLCKIEGLSEPDKALVFTPLSSPTPKEDSARIPFLIDVSYTNFSALINFAVYYRVYLSEGKRDEKTKTSFDESDISLGRINTLFIAPPHTAGSLKAHIAQVEGLVTPGHALYVEMELFQDMNSDAAMSDTDVISFQGDTHPGSDEGDPIALVNATSTSGYMVINSEGKKGFVQTVLQKFQRYLHEQNPKLHVFIHPDRKKSYKLEGHKPGTKSEEDLPPRPKWTNQAASSRSTLPSAAPRQPALHPNPGQPPHKHLQHSGTHANVHKHGDACVVGLDHRRLMGSVTLHRMGARKRKFPLG
ncbi:uncharacterized protein LACBIDRAFT_330866 [Laccaria bicolor S238N-H82]|uniref:Predicted protein n=1 Tax=Laccaria bicolor (strain S238N-H82 / ATCC MYA-4686) TaxID=486041 RepID=B0DN05_LACBS|nr:uncharacterized protein LACBIDRAFT_330866 [Laccaria bicolor S238N-H82]EDR03967.1 predicted protein [Laccaria bicolor S238N-H82]|eukprot:XP_001885222.1 predicted protein [Laccaria bicolor S238N-H82]